LKKRRRFYIVDVFAEEKYAGNQLAVFRDSEDLSEREMQKFAREMNFSESSFILCEEERDGGYDVRIFTPETEIPFAGHPTLGTAFIIQQEIKKKKNETIYLNLRVGKIPVTLSYRKEEVEFLWMKQKQPVFGRCFEPGKIAHILSLELEDIDDRFPIQEVSTGLPFIIVPLRSLRSVKRVKILRKEFMELIKNTEAKDMLVFSPETYHKENDLNVRVFVEYEGVPEDPATGSANGCLAAYLVRYRYFRKPKVEVRVEQGYEIGRPSLLFLKAEEKDEGIDVSVGGRVILVARGEFV